MTRTSFFKLLLTLFISCNFGFVAFSQYQQDSIKTDDGYLHYYTKGQGKPLVLLQGGPGFSSYYMRAVADSIKNYQTILIDFEGTGRSQYRQADTKWVSIDKMAHDLELVRNKLKITDWAVIGHSYGGMLALYYATQFPEIVNKIISIDGVSTDNQFQLYFSDNIKRNLTKEELLQIDNLLASDIPFKEKMAQYQLKLTPAYFFNQDLAGQFLNSFPADEAKLLMNAEFFNAYISTPEFRSFDIGSEVYQLKTPIRIIHGRQDPIGEGIPVLLHERTQNSKLSFIEKCGHFPWVEQPEQFYPILKSFIED